MIDISFLIPIYNAEKTIAKCIDSILSLQLKSYEIILIDDGSTDKTKEIIEKYNSKKVKYFYQKNSGVSKARNIAIQNASGYYITFVDADDTVDLKFKSLFEYANKYDLDYCCSGYKYITPKKKIDIIPPRVNSSKNNEICYLFCKSYFGYVWGKLYKKDILIKNNLYFDEVLNFGEDLNFNLRFFPFLKNIGLFNKVCYQYYNITNSLSKKYVENFDEYKIKLLNSYKNIIDNNNEFNIAFSKEMTPFELQILMSEIINILRSPYNKKNKIKLIKKIQHNNKVMLKKYKIYNCKNIKDKIIFLCLKLKQIKFIFLIYSFKTKFNF